MSSQNSISFLEIAQKHKIPSYQIPTLHLLFETTKEDTDALHILLDLLNQEAYNMLKTVIGAISSGKLADEKLFSTDLSFTPREI